MEDRNKTLSNIQRVLTMLEKAVDRLSRQKFLLPSQRPAILDQIASAIRTMRGWIDDWRMFAGVKTFYAVASLCLKELSNIVNVLAEGIKPVSGKKQVKRTKREKDCRALFKTADDMLEHMAKLLCEAAPRDTVVSLEMEKAVLKAFYVHCSRKIEKDTEEIASDRGEKTYIFPWGDPDGYVELVGDRGKFKAEVAEFPEKNARATGRKPHCKNSSGYRLCGFRQKPRRTFAVEGRREFLIRMVQCLSCDRRFSMVPSFPPREKHFCLNIIGRVFDKMLRFGASIQGALENPKLLKKPVKSRQTVLNWLRWMGTPHPAAILSRAGVKGSGYLREDEGFEKEPNLRTYSVVMADPANMPVWHSDCVDAIDEDTLAASFEKFVEKIEFKVLGVTKDKWAASTNALKSVFKNIWIGFCRRHFLKKLYGDLLKYRKETGCSQKDVSELYWEVKKILETSYSGGALKARLNTLRRDEFKHPLLKGRIDSLKEDAVRHTSFKNRKGITPTTSKADGFLKIVKRKLRQAESFRDRDCTLHLFRAMANARNFLPFLPGAKNAHKNPFMLAQGETFDLPWIEAMNVHNAFLFSDNAF